MSKSKLAEPIIGIDLGTTYSCVAIWKDGVVEILPNPMGQRTTPSQVAFTPSEILVGTSAKNQLTSNPSNTIYAAKRLIGRRFDDPKVTEEIPKLPYKVKSSGPEKKILLEVEREGRLESFAPEQISALILSHMRKIAEDSLGTPVTKAVITCPAYFNNSQRQATKDAAQIAGLEVLEIISEPVAAALAYGITRTDGFDGKVLIFDFGAGTLDVSLLEIDGDNFTVLAGSGDDQLGGEDFDNLLVDHCLAEIEKKHGLNLRKDERARTRLKVQCELAKIQLSASPSATIHVDFLSKGLDFHHELSRAKFEEICKAVFDRAMKPVTQVLKDEKLDKSRVGKIVMVGGSSKIPKIQALVSGYFQGMELHKSLNPDEAIAYGAALKGAKLVSKKNELDFFLQDVTILSLGIETKGEKMSVVVPRNSQIPIRRKETYVTTEDYQTEVSVLIYQGEEDQTKRNVLLGSFDLNGITPLKKGKADIVVTFELDRNNLLVVTATETLSNSTNSLKIATKDNRLSLDMISSMTEKNKKMFSPASRVHSTGRWASHGLD